MFDDVDTAFVGGKNMAPDFAALERRASRPDFDIPDPVAEPPAMRPRMQSLDFGGGVVVETLEEFEPNRSHQEVSDAWRPDLAPPPARAEHANVMRLESIQPPAFDPRSAPTAPIHAARPPMPTLDLQAEAQRAAGVGKVRVAYVIAGISILLLIAAILSAIFVW